MCRREGNKRANFETFRDLDGRVSFILGAVLGFVVCLHLQLANQFLSKSAKKTRVLAKCIKNVWDRKSNVLLLMHSPNDDNYYFHAS